MVSVLPEDGILILNADDQNIKSIDLSGFKGRVIWYGLQKHCDFYAEDIKYALTGMEFTLVFNKVKYRIFVPGYGEHQVYNAVAAICCAHFLGIGISEACKQLASFRNLPRHLQLCDGINESLVLDDSWNFNTISLAAALKTLSNIAVDKYKIAFLGSMGALGDFDVTVVISDMLIEHDLDVIILIGETAEGIKEKLIEKGYKGNVYSLPKIDEEYLFDLMSWLLKKNTVLLAKCSMFDDEFHNFLNRLKKK